MNYLASPESFYQLKLPSQFEFSVCDFVVWMVVDYNLHMIGVVRVPRKTVLFENLLVIDDCIMYIQTY